MEIKNSCRLTVFSNDKVRDDSRRDKVESRRAWDIFKRLIRHLTDK